MPHPRRPTHCNFPDTDRRETIHGWRQSLRHGGRLDRSAHCGALAFLVVPAGATDRPGVEPPGAPRPGLRAAVSRRYRRPAAGHSPGTRRTAPRARGAGGCRAHAARHAADAGPLVPGHAAGAGLTRRPAGVPVVSSARRPHVGRQRARRAGARLARRYPPGRPAPRPGRRGPLQRLVDPTGCWLARDAADPRRLRQRIGARRMPLTTTAVRGHPRGLVRPARVRPPRPPCQAGAGRPRPGRRRTSDRHRPACRTPTLRLSSAPATCGGRPSTGHARRPADRRRPPPAQATAEREAAHLGAVHAALADVAIPPRPGRRPRRRRPPGRSRRTRADRCVPLSLQIAHRWSRRTHPPARESLFSCNFYRAHLSPGRHPTGNFSLAFRKVCRQLRNHTS